MQLCSNAAELCEVQKLKGVTALSSKAVTAGLTEQHWCNWHQQVPKLQCCASLLKCSSGVRSAKTHRCDCTVKQGCLQLASKEQHWCSWHEQVSQASVMCIFAEMQQRCVMQKLIGVTALSSKAVTAGLTEQHWCSWHEQVSQASVLCNFAQMHQSCVKCKNSKV